MSSPTEQPTLSRIDWRAAQTRFSEKLSEEERQIVDLLAKGKSTPDIAKALGTNRSAIWRKIQKIKQQLCLTS
jgi:DNA-binding NarL/FixJ family response regulator